MVGAIRHEDDPTLIHSLRNGTLPGPVAKENFQSDAIYNILQDTYNQESTSIKLKKMKAKIVRLYHMAQRRLFLDTDEHDRIAEEVSLYRILKLRKRQEARIVYKVHDSHDNSQTASTAIIRKTMEFMRMKYDYIQVDKESARSIANNLNKKLPQAANNVSETPITIDELHLAVKKGKPLKAPGSD